MVIPFSIPLPILMPLLLSNNNQDIQRRNNKDLEEMKIIWTIPELTIIRLNGHRRLKKKVYVSILYTFNFRSITFICS